jgi:hypothetical protein
MAGNPALSANRDYENELLSITLVVLFCHASGQEGVPALGSYLKAAGFSSYLTVLAQL